MTPLEILIAHWRERARDCDAEIDELVDIYNSPGSPYSEKEFKNSVTEWRVHRTFARDTASYLEAMVKMKSAKTKETT